MVSSNRTGQPLATIQPISGLQLCSASAMCHGIRNGNSEDTSDIICKMGVVYGCGLEYKARLWGGASCP